MNRSPNTYRIIRLITAQYNSRGREDLKHFLIASATIDIHLLEFYIVEIEDFIA